MRYLMMMMSLLCAAAVAGAADDRNLDQQNVSELCSIQTVAVVGDDQFAKETSKRVEKKTWMKKVGAPDQADGILDVQILITSISISPSGRARGQGEMTMKLTRRQPEKVVWEGRQALDTGNLIDDLLTSLQHKAGCGKR